MKERILKWIPAISLFTLLVAVFTGFILIMAHI